MSKTIFSKINNNNVLKVDFQLLKAIYERFKLRKASWINKVKKHSLLRNNKDFDILKDVHQSLTETKCENCGKCCNAISIFSLEYDYIICYLIETLSDIKFELFLDKAINMRKRLLQIEHSNKTEFRVKCVFRDEQTNRCSIYPVRPIDCRLFGMLKHPDIRECKFVKDKQNYKPLTEDYIVNLKAPIMQKSLKLTPFKDFGELSFFPFETWLYNAIFGEKGAMKIYREIQIPSSTPLIKMWGSLLFNIEI